MPCTLISKVYIIKYVVLFCKSVYYYNLVGGQWVKMASFANSGIFTFVSYTYVHQCALSLTNK